MRVPSGARLDAQPQHTASDSSHNLLSDANHARPHAITPIATSAGCLGREITAASDVSFYHSNPHWACVGNVQSTGWDWGRRADRLEQMRFPRGSLRGEKC